MASETPTTARNGSSSTTSMSTKRKRADGIAAHRPAKTTCRNMQNMVTDNNDLNVSTSVPRTAHTTVQPLHLLRVRNHCAAHIVTPQNDPLAPLPIPQLPQPNSLYLQTSTLRSSDAFQCLMDAARSPPASPNRRVLPPSTYPVNNNGGISPRRSHRRTHSSTYMHLESQPAFHECCDVCARQAITLCFHCCRPFCGSCVAAVYRPQSVEPRDFCLDCRDLRCS